MDLDVNLSHLQPQDALKMNNLRLSAEYHRCPLSDQATRINGKSWGFQLQGGTAVPLKKWLHNHW